MFIFLFGRDIFLYYLKNEYMKKKRFINKYHHKEPVVYYVPASSIIKCAKLYLSPIIVIVNCPIYVMKIMKI